jgi:hypothetical protein
VSLLLRKVFSIWSVELVLRTGVVYVCAGSNAVGCTRNVLISVVLHVRVTMPLAWIYDLSKQQLEELCSQLNLTAGSTLDGLRK